MDNDFELVLCVAKNGGLHQAILNNEQMELLKDILPCIIGNNPLRYRETPICAVAIEKKLPKISAEQCTDRATGFTKEDRANI